MRVALVTTFQANKKEPLATLLGRIHAAFLEAGLGEPAIEFSFSDAAGYKVYGLGFKARLPLPVSKRAGGGQYKIGDAAHWQKLVDNMAALVAELDRSFVPAIEAAAGPSPEWYKPES